MTSHPLYGKFDETAMPFPITNCKLHDIVHGVNLPNQPRLVADIILFTTDFSTILSVVIAGFPGFLFTINSINWFQGGYCWWYRTPYNLPPIVDSWWFMTFLDPQWLGNHQALCSMPCLAVRLRHRHQCQSLPLMDPVTRWPPRGTECIGNSLHNFFMLVEMLEVYTCETP